MECETTNTRRLRPDTLAASVTILLVANIVQRTIGFGRGILFCRWLTPDELGTWEMAYSFLLLAAPIIVLGLPGSFGRYLERFRQRGQLRTFLRRATIWTAAVDDRRVRIDYRSQAPIFGLDLRASRCDYACYRLGTQPRRGDPASLFGSAVCGAAKVQHRFDDAFLPEHFVCRHLAGTDVVLAVLGGKHRDRLRRGVPGVGGRHSGLEGQGGGRRSGARRTDSPTASSGRPWCGSRFGYG